MNLTVIKDETGRQLELNPLCVLDFFIEESMQRKGYGINYLISGKQLFQHMCSVITEY